ncbi:hypothetical protein RB195_009021 [Necator americanus]|uniref:Uncharacterized protein n=1 Tax=Necator americanus TaxID=51031 RepID=A0ABR1CRF1_NECAM
MVFRLVCLNEDINRRTTTFRTSTGCASPFEVATRERERTVAAGPVQRCRRRYHAKNSWADFIYVVLAPFGRHFIDVECVDLAHSFQAGGTAIFCRFCFD